MREKDFLVKRIFLMIIFLLLTIILVPKQVMAAEVVETWDISATESDHVTATLYDDGKLVINGTGNMKNEEVIDYTDEVTIIEIENGVTTANIPGKDACLTFLNEIRKNNM